MPAEWRGISFDSPHSRFTGLSSKPPCPKRLMTSGRKRWTIHPSGRMSRLSISRAWARTGRVSRSTPGDVYKRQAPYRTGNEVPYCLHRNLSTIDGKPIDPYISQSQLRNRIDPKQDNQNNFPFFHCEFLFFPGSPGTGGYNPFILKNQIGIFFQ